MTDRPVKIGSISAQILALMLTDEHYRDRLRLLMDMSVALNREYHALADAGAPIVQVEEPAIHQVINDPNASIKPRAMGRGLQPRGARPARQMRSVVPHLLGQPGRAAGGQPRPSYKAALPYLDQLDVDVITVEAADNRGIDLERRRDDLEGQEGRIGVISHRTLQVERPEEVADLVRKALEHIEPERLILSSDCGFGRQAMSRMHAFYKMVALVRGANIVRRELGLAEAHVPAMDARLSMVPLAE